MHGLHVTIQLDTSNAFPILLVKLEEIIDTVSLKSVKATVFLIIINQYYFLEYYNVLYIYVRVNTNRQY